MLRPHQRQPRRRRHRCEKIDFFSAEILFKKMPFRRPEHAYEVIASTATKRTRGLLDQQFNHNIAIRN